MEKFHSNVKLLWFIYKNKCYRNIIVKIINKVIKMKKVNAKDIIKQLKIDKLCFVLL